MNKAWLVTVEDTHEFLGWLLAVKCLLSPPVCGRALATPVPPARVPLPINAQRLLSDNKCILLQNGDQACKQAKHKSQQS
jgi:hypothetical protein